MLINKLNKHNTYLVAVGNMLTIADTNADDDMLPIDILPAANNNVAVEFGAQFNAIPQVPEINNPKTIQILKNINEL